MKRLRIGHEWEFGFNETIIVDYARKEIAVRRLGDGSWFAFSKYCPHQGADLSEVEIVDGAIRCPWHGLCFELESGANITNQCDPLRIYQVTVIRSEVFLSESKTVAPQMRTYLCRYGWDRRIGRFESSGDMNFSSGDLCIGITARGAERVTILNESLTAGGALVTGRITGISDSETEATDNIAFKVSTYLEDEFLNQNMDIEILNVEVLLDNQAIVHYIGTDQESLGPISVSASHRLGLSVSFHRAQFNV
ncbi:MAG: hypothetical protein CMM02_19960 [Rhodopirellula sp.]|nr:hypothetical protein [Rhodopirellula sp.]